MGVGFALVAFFLPTNFFFKATLAIFWLLAFNSATHDIAADGFYIIGLSEHDQSWFVGIRSTFYRLAMIAGQGAIVMLAGTIENATGLESVTVDIRTEKGYVAESFNMVSMQNSAVKPLPGPMRIVSLNGNQVVIGTGLLIPLVLNKLLKLQIA